MSDTDVEPKGVAEVLRLLNELAEQILALQVMQRPIPSNQLTTLISAAQFLEANEVAWPPLVQEVIHEIAERMDAVRLDPSNEAALG
ncbi:hypothetical protein MKL09_27215 [Methylobacterium sp. J-048]|uniref:hypothetical protein n=1 Tax=unclassified Methylobacterium TaxID=2615210 RepID=UPI001FB9F6C2|nr:MULTISPECIES: hypothetical protein [unclassified Methylobacterium]MCJ2060205.1 hypothetical protein [Methylobacterium sp. J-048]MCJ2094940.1 hypothetical protein [Methylobacterium sp. J-072]